MKKVLVLKENQKKEFIDGVKLGTWCNETKDSLSNTLKYLNITTLNNASKKLTDIKSMTEYKLALTSYEKKSVLKKEIEKIVDTEIKNACFLLSSNLKKSVLVPKTDVFKLMIKTFDKKVKVVLAKSVITCIGNETTDDIIFSFDTELDFITDENLLGCKYSDEIIDIFSDFMNNKKEYGTAEAISQSENDSDELLNKYRLNATTQLLEYFSSSTVKYIVK